MFRPLNAERVYYVETGVHFLASSLMFTVYAVYLVKMAGLDPLQLVLVGTVLELTAFIFEVPTGVVADAFSRRLSIVLGMFFLGASFVLTGAVPQFGVILLAQVVSGVGYTFLSGALDAWLVDEVGEEHVGGVYLRAGQIGRVADLAGTALSVALASVQLGLPFLVGGMLFLALGVFLVLFMPEHRLRRADALTPRPREARSSWASLRATYLDGWRVVRASTILLALLGVELFTGAASEGFDRLGDAHLLANFTFPSLGALQPVVWFAILGVAGSIISLVVVEPLRQRMEAVSRDPAASVRALIVFELINIASVFVFALSGNFWLAVAALMVRGVAGSLKGPLFTTWLVKHIRPEVRATVLSMVSQSNALGQIAGGPGVGLIGNVFGLRVALTTAAVLLIPALPFYLRVADEQPVAEGATEAA